LSTTVTARVASLLTRPKAHVADEGVLVQHPRRPLPGLVERVASGLGRGDQFGLFLIAAIGMFLLSPKVLLLGYSILAERLTNGTVQVDWRSWPTIPVMLPVGVTVAMLCFRMPRTWRTSVLVAALGIVAVTFGPLTPGTLIPITIFVLAIYALIRLPLPRLAVALLVSAWMVASLWIALRYFPDTPGAALLGGFAIVLPLLWYSVYEHKREAALSLHRFVLFIAGRLFGSPVMTYHDVFTPVQGAELTAVRWAGVRAIYIALLASFANHTITQLESIVATDSLNGVALLGMSYLSYIGYCCGIVLRFNIFIGVLRLVGVPLRSNFRYWMLARTPNEHWQRWNLLAREWVLTFVFYPIMRARRWLFAAVMGALVIVGIIHMLPRMMMTGLPGPEMTARAVYWIANGLAIYLVIKIPQSFPALITRLGMPGSRAWSVAGVVLTSSFYAFLHGLRISSDSWAHLRQYLISLTQVLPG
jgi:hypothetical protein